MIKEKEKEKEYLHIRHFGGFCLASKQVNTGNIRRKA
jgi:hypothetical protein